MPICATRSRGPFLAAVGPQEPPRAPEKGFRGLRKCAWAPHIDFYQKKNASKCFRKGFRNEKKNASECFRKGFRKKKELPKKGSDPQNGFRKRVPTPQKASENPKNKNLTAKPGSGPSATSELQSWSSEFQSWTFHFKVVVEVRVKVEVRNCNCAVLKSPRTYRPEPPRRTCTRAALVPTDTQTDKQTRVEVERPGNWSSSKEL